MRSPATDPEGEGASMEYGMWWATADTSLGRVALQSGLDMLAIDLQHSLVTETTVLELSQTTQLPGSAKLWVRVASSANARIGKALDAGADAVIVPFVDTADEASRAVRACLHQPKGTRSFGPASVKTDAINDGHCVIMVESRESYENLAEIVATPDLYGVLVGPADLSLDLGMKVTTSLGLVHQPEVAEVLRGIVEICREAGVLCGVALGSWDEVPTARELGFSYVIAGFETVLLHQAISERVAALEADSDKAGSAPAY
ncbi:HpcH/HpaI aldolase family protein [Enemella sp. A6]|uniref:HpcH/HpaI aldolase family protein n=1 Tax=Enemella sp. A6 TaxID=3440152 RepID=UPI003EB8B2BB